jgi:hypothetical protein
LNLKSNNQISKKIQFYDNTLYIDGQQLRNVDPEGFLKDYKEMISLNEEINRESINKINQREIQEAFKTALLEILQQTGGFKDHNRVVVENCSLNGNGFYDCTFAVSIDENTQKIFGEKQDKSKELAKFLNATCNGEGDTCFVRNKNSIIEVLSRSLEEKNINKYKVGFILFFILFILYFS